MLSIMTSRYRNPFDGGKRPKKSRWKREKTFSTGKDLSGAFLECVGRLVS